MYSIGDVVRFNGYKHRILDAWFDGEVMRYEIRRIIGRNLAGEYWCVSEALLQNH